MVGKAKPVDRRVTVAWVFLALLIGLAILVSFPGTGRAQSEDVDTEQLIQGQQVFTDICSSCHQPGGVGIPGSFPPLVDNPHVDDSEYVRGVIQNGRTGEIVVNGETYNGTMPSFSTLDDTQIDAVIAYLQNDLVVPGGTPPPAGGDGSTGTALPPVASGLFMVAFVLAIVIAGWVLAPRIVGVIDHRNTPKLNAWLKSGLVVIYFILATVIIPSMVLRTEVLERLPRGVQDFVAGSLWIGGLAIGLLGLWWFQRQDRI
jgi:mono/diheme cytochrome c family protein